MKIFNENTLLSKKLGEYKAQSFHANGPDGARIRTKHVNGVYYSYTVTTARINGKKSTHTYKSYDIEYCHVVKFIEVLRQNHHLKIIDLRKNKNDWEHTGIPESWLIEILNAIKTNNLLFLECLCLSHDLTDNLLDHLIEIINCKPSLKLIELSDSYAGDDSKQLLSKKLFELKKQVLYASQLQYLGLFRLTSEMAYEFVRNFDLENTSLLQLHYERCKDLVDYKEIDNTIKKFQQRNQDIPEVHSIIQKLTTEVYLKDNALDLSDLIIKATDFTKLVQVLIANKNLVLSKLKLTNALNDVTEDAELLYIEGLVKLLCEKTSLRKLDISNCIFGSNTHILVLAKAIAENYFLTKLVMQDMRFIPKIFTQFVNIIKKNNSLFFIKLSTKLKKRHFSESTFNALNAIAKHNRENSAQLLDAIENNNQEAIQLAIHKGANSFFCRKEKRPRIPIQKQKFEFVVLDNGAVELDDTTTSKLHAHQQQTLRAITTANKLIVNYLKKHVPAGNPLIQYQLALRYLCGNGVKTNEKMAHQGFAAAAAQNHTKSQYLLGMMYLCGRGCQNDTIEAKRWFKKASENKLAKAYYQRALIAYGQGNLFNAKKYFNNACQLGQVLACVTQELLANPATLVARKKTTTVWDNYDIVGDADQKEKALQHILNSAKQKNIPAAQFRLSQLYCLGQTLAVDFDEAFRWCQKAAEQKHIQANYQLAQFYLNGQGCEQSRVSAMQYFEYAAQMGHGAAYYELALFHQPNNADYFDAQSQLALRYLSLAAELGHARALYQLGKLHLGKRLELFSSELAAEKYFQQAHRLGYDKARIQLAKLHLAQQSKALLSTSPMHSSSDEEQGSSGLKYNL